MRFLDKLSQLLPFSESIFVWTFTDTHQERTSCSRNNREAAPSLKLLSDHQAPAQLVPRLKMPLLPAQLKVSLLLCAMPLALTVLTPLQSCRMTPGPDLGQSLKRWSAPLDPITSPGPRLWLAMGKGGIPPRHIPAVAPSWRTNLTFCTTPAFWMQSPSLLREGHEAPHRYCFYSVPILTNAVVHTRR